MIPYYQDESVTIYHGDCREVAGLLAADVILTDPPYGDAGFFKLLAEVAGASLRPGGWLLSYSGQYHLPAVMANLSETLMYRWLIAVNHHPAQSAVRPLAELNLMTEWKPVLVYRRPPLSQLPRIGLHDLLRGIGRSKSSHPWEQGVGEARTLLAPFVGEVLDPFMGSGTTLRAAKDLGRKAIGIEIEERYCEIAARRMAQEVLAI